MSTNLRNEAEAARMLLDAMALRDEDDDVIETAIEGETSFMEAVDAALLRLTEIEGMAKGIDQAIERLKSRSSRLDAQAARIRSSMLLAIDTVGLKKLERPTATLSLAKSPDKMVVINEESLPARYLVEKTTIAPDKKALLADLKAGVVIVGAELSNGGVQLRINKG